MSSTKYMATGMLYCTQKKKVVENGTMVLREQGSTVQTGKQVEIPSKNDEVWIRADR
jgi:hypothetical protein